MHLTLTILSFGVLIACGESATPINDATLVDSSADAEPQGGPANETTDAADVSRSGDTAKPDATLDDVAEPDSHDAVDSSPSADSGHDIDGQDDIAHGPDSATIDDVAEPDATGDVESTVDATPPIEPDGSIDVQPEGDGGAASPVDADAEVADTTADTGALDALPTADTEADTGALDALPTADTEADTGALDALPTADTEADIEAAPVTCEPPFPCPWEGACTAPTAYLTLHGLDVWAQEVPGMEVSISATNVEWDLASSSTSVTTALCGSTTLEMEATAPWHGAMSASVNYVAPGLEGDILVEVHEGEGSSVLMSTVEDVDGIAISSYSLWLGLTHDYFAASGPPARRGNLVTLLRDGEEAWATVRADLFASEHLVTSATWWWTSELELLRDPFLHPYLTPEERWENTVLGSLESLGSQGVESKVLINQFYSQDGLLDWVTADDAVFEAAMSPDNGIEMLGAANITSGTFEVIAAGAAFADHLLDTWELDVDATLLGSLESEPRLAPQTVDLNALPIGLGIFDIPLASWHQKFMTMDQEVAYIGGMNVKTTDWDTHQHEIFEARRMTFDASLEDRLAVEDKLAVSDFAPRKDYMVRVEGPSAADAVDVFKQRWDLQLASGVENAGLASEFSSATVPLPFAGGVQAQVVTTMPEPFNQTSIADTLLRAISQADDYIYIEDQYFRSPILADAIVDRMLANDNVVLIVVTSPVDEWTDPGCWHTHLQHELLEGLFADRYALFQLQSFDTVDTECSFCIDETEATFQPMNMHSKLVIVDDIYLQIGSCNHNNRGLLYEGEAALAVFDTGWVSEARELIFHNLLGDYYSSDKVGAEWLLLFEGAALWNDLVYTDWDDESFDLDLDGEPVPEFWTPVGFLYSLNPGPPSDCFFEDVGEDVTLGPTRG
jgi:phosphatidylserine/phosphatidylglycerophosphate/cardiolipin synthase-like enzyme